MGRKLPAPVRLKMEQIFAADFSDVRVHVGEEASALGSLAFAHGSDLYFAPGQFDFRTSRGERIIAHELTHVVQQREGRVSRPAVGGRQVVRSPSLEAEAERMGRHAASRGAAQRGPFAGEPCGGRYPSAPAKGAADAGAVWPIQPLLYLGWEPSNPNKWREFTTLTTATLNTKGFNTFNGNKRTQVINDNKAQAAQANPALGPPAFPQGHQFPASDSSRKSLLLPEDSAPLAPEVDHIVERSEGGSNSYANARLLSKTENTNAATARPHTPNHNGVAGETALRTYRSLELKVRNGPPWYGAAGLRKEHVLQRGQELTLEQANILNMVQQGNALNPWAQWNQVDIANIINIIPGNNWVAVGPNNAGNQDVEVKVSQ